jgi:dolichol-phosphate mannosyltransferase
VLIQNELNFPENVLFEYIMVDDGSKDNTIDEIKKFQARHHQEVKIVKLARNFGSYNAIVAGMEYATGDCAVCISADLQDPPELIVQMYTHWERGVKFVVANRQDREDTIGQKIFSNLYHTLIRKFALTNIPKGGFDVFLFDKTLKEQVVKMQEKNTNTAYLLAWLGYDFVCIPYIRKKRELGTSRWTFSKKVKLFIDSFVSFSYLPIRLISLSGLFFGLIAVIYATYLLINKFLGNIQVQGWTSMMAVFLFISSFQMIALGILGEYIWRTLDASNSRPNYVVDEVLVKNDNNLKKQ